MTHNKASRSSASLVRRISTYLYLHPWATLGLLLGPPLVWMGVVYLGSLLTLVLQSFFYLDGFSGRVIHQLTLATYVDLLTQFENYRITLRTTLMAASVTLAAVFMAFPLAYYMARFATQRVKSVMYFFVLLPLWSNYLVRVFAWKIILAKEGIVSWFFQTLHVSWILDGVLKLPSIGGTSLSNSNIGMFLVFLYIWLPYMVLPIQASLERVPGSLLEASSDLGAKPRQTFLNVIFPLAFPGVVAGSIFTFSLTLGDFIIPTQFGSSEFFIGRAVYEYQGTSGNIPLAAAFTVIPILIMAIYLSVARRLGAFEAL